MYKNKGFTLVEVMIVVGIIAILAGIFLVGSGQFRASANVARMKADLQKIEALQELYYTRNNTYAGCLTGAGCLADSLGVTAPTAPVNGVSYTTDTTQSCASGVPANYGWTDTCLTR